MDILIFSIFLFIILGFSAMYFFSKPKVFMCGLVAGILLILLGAFITTQDFTTSNCFDVVNQTELNTTTNITTYTNDVLCEEYVYPTPWNLRLALGTMFMLLGLGYILYCFGTREVKPQ